jgi:hypothetical protein
VDVAASSFVVIGDFGSGSEAELEVAATIESLVSGQPIEGLVTMGDNFYSDDIEAIWVTPYGWGQAGILILEVGTDRIVATATAPDGSILDSFIVETAP